MLQGGRKFFERTLSADKVLVGKIREMFQARHSSTLINYF